MSPNLKRNVYVIRVMKALTKESRHMRGSFCYTYACLSSYPKAFYGLTGVFCPKFPFINDRIVKNPAAETAGRLLFECLFFSVIPAIPNAFGRSGILPERFRTSRNDRNIELWQRPQGVLIIKLAKFNATPAMQVQAGKD